MADGCPATRLGFRVILNQRGLDIVGETGDCERTLMLTQELRPDLVILCLNVAGKRSAIEICRLIKAMPAAPYVLVHTAHDFAKALPSCVQAGADCCLHTHTDPEGFLNALHRTVVGELIWQVDRYDKEERSVDDVIFQSDKLTPER